MNMQQQHDPNVIIEAAERKREQNDVKGAQMIYQSALLDWADDAMEASSSSDQAEQLREAIATLWLAYASMNRSAKLFKSASEAYESAVNDPIVGSVGRVWLDYAHFQEERKRHKSAQNVYLRALVGDGTVGPAVKDEQDQGVLWDEFLTMMRKVNGNPSLSLEDLKLAIEEEQVAKKLQQQQQDIMVQQQQQQDSITAQQHQQQMATGGLETHQPVAKRPRLDDPFTIAAAIANSNINNNNNNIANNRLIETTILGVERVTPAVVEAEASSLTTSIQDLPPEIKADWFVRDGDAPATRPNPPLLRPSPPKLSDATGKELLGAELALLVIQRLRKTSKMDIAGSVVLDVCRGLWLLTAMKEEDANTSLEKLDAKLVAEWEELERNLDTRLAVAGAAATAVQQLNEGERNAFMTSANQRRQNLLHSIAWEFRRLLCMEQQLFTKLGVPGFDGPTVDANTVELQSRVCSFLHSAFFIRSRVGEDQHDAMLHSLEDRLQAAVAAQQQETAVQMQTTTTTNMAPPPPLPYQAFGSVPPPPPPPPHGLPPPPPYSPFGMYNAPPFPGSTMPPPPTHDARSQQQQQQQQQQQPPPYM